MNITCDDTPYIIINHPDIPHYNLEQIEVQVGRRLTRLKVFNDANSKHNNLVYINSNASKVLLLPDHCRIKYRLLNHKPERIQLGPVVGIITTVNRDRDTGLPTGKESYYFGELISYAQRHGVFTYLFYPTAVNWKTQTIRGYTLDFDKDRLPKWVGGEYPLPDIVYNRIRSRNIENSPSVSKLLNKFKYVGIHLFNTRFMDKWDVYNALQSNPRLMQVLPPTDLFNYKNLYKFLQQFPEVFLKPRNSSIGKGIIKVKKSPSCYMFALAKSDKPSWQRHASSEKLYEAILAMMDDSSRYLIQMGIPLAKIDNKVFDLRVQVQKNGKGIWTLTGVGVRAAAREHFVTHIPNGGSARPYPEVIEKTFGSSLDKKKSLHDQLRLITTEVPITLERLQGWSLAILSIDIGIDQEGKMWIIEVNSKPSSFDEPDIRRRHLKYLTDYCKYIFSL